MNLIHNVFPYLTEFLFLLCNNVNLTVAAQGAGIQVLLVLMCFMACWKTNESLSNFILNFYLTQHTLKRELITRGRFLWWYIHTDRVQHPHNGYSTQLGSVLVSVSVQFEQFFRHDTIVSINICVESRGLSVGECAQSNLKYLADVWLSNVIKQNVIFKTIFLIFSLIMFDFIFTHSDSDICNCNSVMRKDLGVKYAF